MNLSTKYMGLELKNPIVPSAGPFSETLEGIKRMEDSGAAAVVMFSVFEEQIRKEADAVDYLSHMADDSFAEGLSFFPSTDDYRVGPDRYLDLIRSATEQTDMPIIGSLNGLSHEGWVDYAKQIEQAGAKGLELNVYFMPTNVAESGVQVEQRYMDVLKAVKTSVGIPVALKLSPFFSSFAHAANSFVDCGADALVMFNRFYQPDLDMDSREVVSTLNLSTPSEIRLPLRWIAVLSNQLNCSIAATTGVHSTTEVVKYLAAGADITMTTSSLLQRGVEHIATLIQGLEQWLEANEYESVEQLKGCMAQTSVSEPSAFERANYIKIIENYKAQYTLA